MNFFGHFWLSAKHREESLPRKIDP